MTPRPILTLLPGTMLVSAALCLAFCSLPQRASAFYAASGTVAFPDSLPFNLQMPDRTLRLDEPALSELSGLSPGDHPGELAGIADERGEIFWLDSTGKVTRRVLFAEKGDFEGLEMAGSCAYAVKSNGDLYEVGCWDAAKPAIRVFKTALKKSDDVEGLCFDASRRALLVVAKGDPASDSLRGIFVFDLKTKQLAPKPLFTLDPREVNRMVPYDTDEKHDFFSPSSIAIDPLTRDIYLISTALKRLVVLDPATGKIRHAVALDKKILPQPEGLAFDAAGNLYIGSEGKGSNGLILRFARLAPGGR